MNIISRSVFAASLAFGVCGARAADADAVAWVFDGNTNRVAVATASSAGGTSLRTRLSNDGVASATSILMTTKAPGVAVIIR